MRNVRLLVLLARGRAIRASGCISAATYPESRTSNTPDSTAKRIVCPHRQPGITSVYVPNGGRFCRQNAFPGIDGALRDECRTRKIDLILCGDMNVARTDMDVHPKERKPNVIGQRPEERELFERVIANGGMVDLGRAFDPDNDRLFTWWPPWRNMRQRNIGWRLDYILASQAAASRVTQCSVCAQFGTSDHAPVVADFADLP